MAEGGYWVRTMEGERIWCCSPETETCNGSGFMNCYCGGDFCCCGNQGEIECLGCENCEVDDDFEEFDDDQESVAAAPLSDRGETV